jgi:hypothetical protein
MAGAGRKRPSHAGDGGGDVGVARASGERKERSGFGRMTEPGGGPVGLTRRSDQWDPPRTKMQFLETLGA